MIVYVVAIENDHEVYLSDVHTERAKAEGLLAEARAGWAWRYGEDGFEDTEDADEVVVLDGPMARLHELELATP